MDCSHNGTKTYWEINYDFSLYKDQFPLKMTKPKGHHHISYFLHIWASFTLTDIFTAYQNETETTFSFCGQLSGNVWHLIGSVWSSLGTSQNRGKRQSQKKGQNLKRTKILEQVKTPRKSRNHKMGLPFNQVECTTKSIIWRWRPLTNWWGKAGCMESE